MFIGYSNKINLNTLNSGDYYEVNETGEVYDDEQEAANACVSIDEEESEDEWGEKEYYEVEYISSTYHKLFTLEPYYVTRQRSFYRSTPSVNITRGFDSIPPGMLGGSKDFSEWKECKNKTEALNEANDLAKRWSQIENEIIIIENDYADVGGEDICAYLSGNLLDEIPDEVYE